MVPLLNQSHGTGPLNLSSGSSTREAPSANHASSLYLLLLWPIAVKPSSLTLFPTRNYFSPGLLLGSPLSRSLVFVCVFFLFFICFVLFLFFFFPFLFHFSVSLCSLVCLILSRYCLMFKCNLNVKMYVVNVIKRGSRVLFLMSNV